MNIRRVMMTVDDRENATLSD